MRYMVLRGGPMGGVMLGTAQPRKPGTGAVIKVQVPGSGPADYRQTGETYTDRKSGRTADVYRYAGPDTTGMDS